MIDIRNGKPNDWGYVLATWIRSFPQIGERDARRNHMRRALSRGKLVVACSSTDPDTLLGWALAEKGDLWWMYVAAEFRKLKLSKKLAQRACES